MTKFISIFLRYFWEVMPWLVIGFFISGILHVFISEKSIKKYIGGKGVLPLIYITLLGTILPVCCVGSLPIAVSLKNKGVHIGAVLSFLIATPATSVSALIVCFSLLGIKFTLWIFFSVIIMGLFIGFLGNILSDFLIDKKLSNITYKAESKNCGRHNVCNMNPSYCSFVDKVKEVFKYAFITIPKNMGIEILVALLLASFVESFNPVKNFIAIYLHGGFAYLFSLIVGTLSYVCSTASVPLVKSFIDNSMNIGAAMTFLLTGPITSLATILVIKKFFGMKTVIFYLFSVLGFSLFSGWLFHYFY